MIELHRGERPLLIGHRGAAALGRENSLESIEAAVRAGVDGVELDVLRTRDGRLVLAHGPGIPSDAPSIEEGLALVRDLGVFVQLDIKLRGVAAGVVAALREAALVERSFVSSFSLPELIAFAAVEPALPRSLTYPEDRLGVTQSMVVRPFVGPGLAVMRRVLHRRLPRWLGAVGAAGATLNWAVVTPEVLRVCRGLGVAVLAWTVNDAGLAKSLVESGVDAIITDDPRIADGGISET